MLQSNHAEERAASVEHIVERRTAPRLAFSIVNAIRDTDHDAGRYASQSNREIHMPNKVPAAAPKA